MQRVLQDLFPLFKGSSDKGCNQIIALYNTIFHSDPFSSKK